MPFLECPAALDGTMPGDRGFDPLRFTDSDWNMAEVIIPAASISASTDKLPMVYWMREAELKHGRLCMIAIVGACACAQAAPIAISRAAPPARRACQCHAIAGWRPLAILGARAAATQLACVLRLEQLASSTGGRRAGAAPTPPGGPCRPP